jgi:hypothetical protein
MNMKIATDRASLKTHDLTRDLRKSEAAKSDFGTAVESIGLQKAENLLLKVKEGRCFPPQRPLIIQGPWALSG